MLNETYLLSINFSEVLEVYFKIESYGLNKLNFRGICGLV